MATRFYLPSTGAAAVSPAVASGWDDSGSFDRRAMVRARISSAMTVAGYQDATAGAGFKALVRQYVSAPIPAQTITGTVKGRLRMQEQTADDNYDRIILGIRVVSNDGSTVRGTLLSVGNYGSTNEFDLAPNAENRNMADGDSLSSVAAETGDRLVVEIGVSTSAGSGSFDGWIEGVFGDDSGTDLAEDETTTSAHNPWIEFSQDLFTSTPASVNIASSVPTGTTAVLAKPASVGMILASSGGSTNVLAKPASVGVVAGISLQSADNVVDSYDPNLDTVLVAINQDTPKTVLRPTTPASLGDQSRNSQEDSGSVIGPGSGDINLFGTVISDPVNASGTISYIKLYGFVSTSDTVPAPNVYIACTAPQFILKVSGGARTTYGLTTGSIPSTTGVFKHPIWIGSNITTRPAGGAWTWTDLANLVELGVTAHYVLGTNEFTNLRLDEVWLEVYGPQGVNVPPMEVRAFLGNLVKTLKVPSSI